MSERSPRLPHTYAEVVRVVESTNPDGDLVLVPVLRYDVDGRTYETPYRSTGIEAEMHIGERVLLAYRPSDPAEIYVLSDRIEATSAISQIAEGRALASKRSTELVELVLTNETNVKLVSAELRRRSPSEEAARRLSDAYAAKRARAGIIALLLGDVGHELGYGTALDILLRAGDTSTASYAAHTMVRIAGPSAETDLVRALREAAPAQSAVRSVAAEALGKIGSRAAIDAVIGAMEARRTFAYTAARALTAAPVDPALLVDLLRNGRDEVERLFVICLVAERARARDGEAARDELARIANPELVATLRAELAREGCRAWGGDRDAISAWLSTTRSR